MSYGSYYELRDDAIWWLTLGFRRPTAKSAAPTPPFAVVRDLEVAAKKRRGFPRLGVLQPGAGRVERGDPQNSAILRLKACLQTDTKKLEVWAPS